MTTGAVKIRRHRQSDRTAVAELRRAVYGSEAVSEEWWEWRHEGLGAPSGMHVAVAGGEVVGVQPVETYDFLLDGRRLQGAVLTGAMVRDDHRRRGVFLRLVEACEAWAWEKGADFVATMPNDRSRPAFLARSYIDPGPRTLMVRPLATGRVLGRVLGADRATALVDRPIDRGSGRAHRLWLRLRGPSAALRIDEVDRFDPVLADALASRPPAGLVQLRSREWLEWRYAAAPGRPYSLFEARADGDAVGFAVTRRQQRGKLDVGFLVDLSAMEPAWVTVLAGHAAVELRAAGADLAIAVVSGRQLIRRLAVAGYVPVPHVLSPKKFHTVYRPNAACVETLAPLQSIDAWHQTLGDWDTV